MTIRGNYVPPKKRKKLNYKIVIPFLVLAIALFYLSYNVFLKPAENDETGYTICGFTPFKTREVLKETTSDNTIESADYFYYGETLSILHNTYDINGRDDFAGRTMYLKNLCNGVEINYFLGATIDSQIPVESLSEGYYAVYVSQDLDKARVISTEIIEDTFFSVRREGITKKIKLLSDPSMYDSQIEKNVLDKNYMFIEISDINAEEASEDDSYYDVAIDPFGNNADSGSVYPGVSGNGISENTEMYEVALVIKKELESKGLSVIIVKDNVDETVNIYGENGRIYRAAQAHAKYYLDLQMNTTADDTAAGGQIVYSSYTSNKFATAIFKYLQENTDLPAISYGSGDNYNGVLMSSNTDGYDTRSAIRESGGYALYAGMTQSATLDFASLDQFMANNRHGMQTVTLEYLMVSNEAMVSMWQNNRDTIGIATARGFLIAIGLTD